MFCRQAEPSPLATPFVERHAQPSFASCGPRYRSNEPQAQRSNFQLSTFNSSRFGGGGSGVELGWRRWAFVASSFARRSWTLASLSALAIWTVWSVGALDVVERPVGDVMLRLLRSHRRRTRPLRRGPDRRPVRGRGRPAAVAAVTARRTRRDDPIARRARGGGGPPAGRSGPRNRGRALAAALGRVPTTLAAVLAPHAGWILPLERFGGAQRAAHAHAEVAPDGVVRSIASTKQSGGLSLPALSVAAARLAGWSGVIPVGEVIRPDFRLPPESVPSVSARDLLSRADRGERFYRQGGPRRSVGLGNRGPVRGPGRGAQPACAGRPRPRIDRVFNRAERSPHKPSRLDRAADHGGRRSGRPVGQVIGRPVADLTTGGARRRGDRRRGRAPFGGETSCCRWFHCCWSWRSPRPVVKRWSRSKRSVRPERYWRRWSNPGPWRPRSTRPPACAGRLRLARGLQRQIARDSELRSALIEGLREGVVLWDADGRPLLANDAAGQLWGVTPPRQEVTSALNEPAVATVR